MCWLWLRGNIIVQADVDANGVLWNINWSYKINNIKNIPINLMWISMVSGGTSVPSLT